MGELFFTGDLHLEHDKEFLYKPRGFDNIDDHDETIIKNWNELVSLDDEVIVVGDIMMGPNRTRGLEKLNRLNGKIIIYRGNHDTDTKIDDYAKHCPNVHIGGDRHQIYSDVIKVGKWRFYLCHWPTILGDFNFVKPNHRHFSLHGHTHSKDKFQFLQYCCYNVSLDAHNNRPVNVKQIQNDLIVEIQKMIERNKDKSRA